MSSSIEAHNETMNFKTNEIELGIISVFFLVLSLIGVAWTFTSGLIGSGIDGILLLLVALLMAAVFALQILYIGRDAGWIKFPALASAKKTTAPAAKPAPAPAAKAAPSPVTEAK
jgi:drug/metabolite transporter (DMT)-like permease